MAQDSGSSWWIEVIASASASSAAGGLWVVWKALLDRKDKHDSEGLARGQTLMHDLDAQRVAASREAADIFERVKLELARRDAEAVRKDARIETLEKEIERWISVARGWQTRCFSLKHALNNSRLEINTQLLKSGQIERTWENDSLPSSLEESAK